MKDKLIALHDILNEISFLQSIRLRHNFETFKESSTDVRAASYSIMIISEAVRRVPEAWLAEHPETPWHAIRAIGNKLRHEYQRVSEFILWDIISGSSDRLESAIKMILEKQNNKT